MDVHILNLILIILISESCALQYVETHHMNLSYKYSFRKGCRLADGRIFLQVGISILDCVHECVSRKGCLELTFNRRTHVCELFSDIDDIHHSKRDCTRIVRTEIDVIQEPAVCNDCGIDEKCQTETDDTTTCRITECPLPLTPLHGKFLGNMVGVGGKIKYVCNDGYKVRDGNDRAVCLSTGSWSESVICVEERDLAAGRPAYQSSTRSYTFHAGKAVDGNLFHPCAFTGDNEIEGWWEVDLEQEYPVKRVVVQTRPSISPSKFKNVTIFIRSSIQSIEDTVCTRYIPEAPLRTSLNLEYSEIVIGRYVRIWKPYQDMYDWLVLCEVKVYMW